MMMRNPQNTDFKWLVNFPPDEKLTPYGIRPCLNIACYGNDHLAALLSYFLYQASREAKNQRLNFDETSTFTLKRTLDEILTESKIHTSKHSLIIWCRTLDAYGYIFSKPYCRNYIVNLEKIRAVIQEPPKEKPKIELQSARGNKTKQVQSENVELQSLRQEVQSLRIEVQSLRDEKVEAAKKIELVSSQVKLLQSRIELVHSWIASSSTFEDGLEVDMNGHDDSFSDLLRVIRDSKSSKSNDSVVSASAESDPPHAEDYLSQLVDYTPYPDPDIELLEACEQETIRMIAQQVPIAQLATTNEPISEQSTSGASQQNSSSMAIGESQSSTVSVSGNVEGATHEHHIPGPLHRPSVDKPADVALSSDAPARGAVKGQHDGSANQPPLQSDNGDNPPARGTHPHSSNGSQGAGRDCAGHLRGVRENTEAEHGVGPGDAPPLAVFTDFQLHSHEAPSPDTNGVVVGSTSSQAVQYPFLGDETATDMPASRVPNGATKVNATQGSTMTGDPATSLLPPSQNKTQKRDKSKKADDEMPKPVRQPRKQKMTPELQAKIDKTFDGFDAILREVTGDPMQSYARTKAATEVIVSVLFPCNPTWDRIRKVYMELWNRPADPKTGFCWREHMSIKAFCNNYETTWMAICARQNGHNGNGHTPSNVISIPTRQPRNLLPPPPSLVTGQAVAFTQGRIH